MKLLVETLKTQTKTALWQVPPHNSSTLSCHCFPNTPLPLPQSSLHLLGTCFCFVCLLLLLELALGPSRAILLHNCFGAQESRTSCGHNIQSALDLYRDRLCFTEELFKIKFYCRQVTKINTVCGVNLNYFGVRSFLNEIKKKKVVAFVKVFIFFFLLKISNSNKN
uniref:Uncharacterized protein n=1 Tax=Bactrocera latifrons TaxID=174628 RepID=A0A0K8VN87_BACLA